MKKRTILSFVSTLAIVGGTFACLTSCGGEKASINNTYAYGVVEENSYGGNTTSTYQLNFLTDSTYELINSSITIGFGMNLGTETVSTYGTYTVGASEDGYTAYTLSTATRVILNSLRDGNNIIINRHVKDEIPIINIKEKTIFIKLSQTSNIKILRYGEYVYDGISKDVEFKIVKSGKYRIEIYLKGKPWIYSNPIMVD